MSFASLWLRPRTSPTIQWVTIPPCPSACHLNSCFGPRGFEPPHPAHPNSVLSLCLGDSHASGLASIPKGSESRKILWESLCPAQERQRLVSLLVSCHVVQTPPPASVPSAHPWGGVGSGIFPQDGTCLSCCCSLSLFSDCFRKVNGIEKSGSHQLKPRVPST